MISPFRLAASISLASVFAFFLLSPVRADEAKRPATADEKEVFAALDLDRPDLASVKAAILAGDYEAASKAWTDHLRQRKGLDWGGKDAPPPKFNHQVADDAVKGKIQGGQVTCVYAFPDGKIDWLFNATKVTPGQSPNAEWQWQINRMAFWNDLAAAYVATGDERYAQAYVAQLHSWIDQCPLPPADKDQNHVGPTAWRTIETGIRMAFNWPASFFRLLPSPSLAPADVMAYTRSTLEQALYLRSHPTSVNWLLMEMNGLATAGCFFPEFRDAAEWRAYAFNRLLGEETAQFLPDGAQYELSTGYHTDVVIPNILSAAKVAQWTGHESELPPKYLDGLEKAYQWIMLLTTPDRSRPKINDSWPGNIGPVLRQASTLFPKRTDFQWFATDGKEGAAPEKTSVFLDWSGIAVMRSGWEKDANDLVFRLGPMGYGGLMGRGHAHQDKLNVALWPYGRELLFTSTGSSYSWDKWRVWSRSSLCENCVAVDGYGQDRPAVLSDSDQEHNPSKVSQKPIDAGWITGPVFDFASAVYDETYGTSEYGPPGIYDPKVGAQHGLKPATQRRSVLFLKPDLYVVADTLTSLDGNDHAYQARWQLLSTRTETDPKTLAVTTTDDALPNLAVVPLLTAGLDVKSASAQETPEILGWNCRKDVNPQNVPATTVLQTRQGKTERFLTLLVPLKPGEKNPVIGVEQGADGATVHLADGRLLKIAASLAGDIDVHELLADGKPGRQAKGTAPR